MIKFSRLRWIGLTKLRMDAMKIANRKFQWLAVSDMVGAGLAGPAQATLDLSGVGYVTYGDANSYALQVEGVIAGSTGPGSLSRNKLIEESMT